MAKKLTAFVESIQESIPVAQRADLWLQTNAVGWTLAEAVSLIAEKAPTPGEAQYELKQQFPILKSTEIAVKRFQLVNAKVQAQSAAFAGTPLYREMMTTLWPYVLVMRKRPLFDTSTEGADRNGDEAERVAAFIKDFARRLGSDRQTRMLFATALSRDTMVKQHWGFGPWLEHSLSTGECAQLV